MAQTDAQKHRRTHNNSTPVHDRKGTKNVSLSEREDERIDFKTAGNDLSINDAKGNDPFASLCVNFVKKVL